MEQSKVSCKVEFDLSGRNAAKAVQYVLVDTVKCVWSE